MRNGFHLALVAVVLGSIVSACGSNPEMIDETADIDFTSDGSGSAMNELACPPSEEYLVVKCGPTSSSRPIAPSNLFVRSGYIVSSSTGAYFTDVTLTWSDNSGNESGFKFERGSVVVSSATSFLVSEAVTVPANTTSAVHYFPFNYQTDSFRVLAFNSSGSSTYSNTVTLPRTPQLQFVRSGGVYSSSTGPVIQLLLDYQDFASNETSFRVERGWLSVGNFIPHSIAGECPALPGVMGQSTCTLYVPMLSGPNYFMMRAVRAHDGGEDTSFAGLPILLQ